MPDQVKPDQVKSDQVKPDPEPAREGNRIAKVMARAGLCSRRDAEQWIAEGRVSVNGEVLASPAFNVSESDDVRVDGEPLRAAERTRLFLFHKPKGLVTTARDPEGRPTIFDALPSELPRVVAIGRLDINTEGLLLLTNDGGLARVLELPATGWLRRYRVRAHGEVTQDQLDGLKGGISIDGVDYLGIDAKFERQQGSNVWLTMGLREGKNREIKRVLEHMGLSVNRLIRVAFGPFELADLADGEVAEVRTRVLRDQLGPKLAKQAGANFDAPVESPDATPPERPARGGRTTRELPHEPPRGDQPPRKRKHVSVLRAQAVEEAAGPRKRITRTTTADRKGRQVQIERVSLAKPPIERATRSARRAPGEGFSRDHAPRREGFGDRRPPRAASGEERPRREYAPRTEGARPFRARTENAGEGAPERAARPRREGPARAEGERTFRPRAPRAEGDRPFRPREPRAEGAGERRPPRGFGEGASERSTRPRREGPARAEGDRPFRPREPRAEGAPDRPARPRADRPARAEGDRPFRPREPRAEGAPDRPARPRRESPARADGDRPFRSRPPRAEGAPDRPVRPRADGDRPFRSREPRAEGAGERRPPRRFGEDAPGRPRREGAVGGEGRPFRPRGEGARPARDGAPSRRPGGGKPGGKPGGGKPGGKPRGGGSGGRPGGRPPPR